MLERSSGRPLPDGGVWVIAADTREGIGARLREFWRYRRVLVFFWIKSVQSLYAKTRLGVPWLFIRTLLPLAVGAFVFGSVMKVSPGTVPYFLFFATGQLAWGFFDGPLLRASRGLEANRELLRKLYIPRVILPMGQMSGGLVRTVIFAVVLALSAVYYRLADGVWYLHRGPELFRAALAAALILAFAFSMSLWTSIWQARARDTRLVLRYVLGFWMYFTPVIYPLSMVPPDLRWLAQLNPLTPPVELFKSGILPGTTYDWPWIAYSAAVTLAVFAGGIWHFQRTESTTMDKM
jgi:lipopolysaccharide transport system permease protein